MNKSYIWTAEIARNENGKFDVWLGEDQATAAHYTDLTAKEIGEILTQDVEAVNQVWEDDEEDK